MVQHSLSRDQAEALRALVKGRCCCQSECELEYGDWWEWDLVRTERFVTSYSTQEIAERLRACGFLYIDHEFLARHVIRAKFDNEFDIWVDSEFPIDEKGEIAFDISAEILLSDETAEETDVCDLAFRLDQRLNETRNALEQAVIGPKVLHRPPLDWEIQRERLHLPLRH